MTIEWAREMVATGAMLKHAPTGAAGAARRAYATGEYKDPDGVPLTAPVVELDTGHAFIADAAVFVVMGRKEAVFHKALYDSMRAFAGQLMIHARSLNIEQDTAVDLIAGAFADQSRALGKAGPREDPGGITF